MHLYFALYEGQAKNHLYVFPYDLNTCLTFIVSFSWSFVCIHFHVYNMVAKFWLSRLYLSCPCFKFLWSQLTNAYIYDQDCVGACHLKNYFFYYHLHTRGWAGVKLGDADTSPTYPRILLCTMRDNQRPKGLVQNFIASSGEITKAFDDWKWVGLKVN
jgi:hypothetical protein